MAYRRKRYGKKSYRGLKAERISRKVYRKDMRLPKKVVAKKHANTVGQIVSRSGRSRPSHGRRMRRY